MLGKGQPIQHTRKLKVLNVSPIILFSEIAQQLRTKEGPRKILLFFTIVVKNNKLKQLRKLFYLHNSPVLTLLVNINISTRCLHYNLLRIPEKQIYIYTYIF